jgi:peptidoglycan/xylan/chitin deacetylase (PgdA/CDA1 family)
MRLNPSHWWTIVLGATFLCWLLAPGLRILSSGLLVCLAAALVWGVVAIESQFFGKVYCRNPDRPTAIALTFDDGPDPDLTPDVLDLLDKYGMKATFFVIAQKAKAHPAIVVRAYRAGHTIACHDLHHSVFSNFRAGRHLVRQLGLAQSMIQSVINARPLLYRPPNGFLNPHVLPAIAEFDMRCIGWSRSANDRGNRSVKAMPRLASLADGGHVVLLHDALPRPFLKEPYLAGLRGLLEACAKQRLTTETVDCFFDLKPYQGALDARSQGIG